MKGTDPLAWGLLALIVLVPCVHALALARKRRFHLLDPLNLFWAGFFVCYASQAAEFGNDIVESNGSEAFVWALAFVVLSEIVVIAGYESQLGQRLGRRLPHTAVSLQPSRLAALAAACLAAGFLGYGLQMASAGGAEDWLAVGRGGTNWETTTAYVAILEGLLPLGVTLSLFLGEYNRDNRRYGLARVVAWVGGATMWWWFLYLGSRSRLILFTLTLLCAYFLPRRKSPPLALGLGVLPVLYLLVGFQANYRGHFTNLSLNLETIDLDLAFRQAMPRGSSRDATGDRRPFSPGLELNCVATVVRLVPDTVNYNYGYGHLEIFTRWIPRAIWPDKVYPGSEAVFPILLEGGLSDTWIATSGKPLLMGPALTFVGHWVAVGGILGLSVASFLTGVLFRAIRHLLERHRGAQGDAILFTVLVPIGFSEAVATPLVWMYTLPLLVLPLLFAVRWAGTATQPERVAPSMPWRSRR